MSKFLAGALAFVVITAVVWISVLWRWESTGHDMSVSDIVIYLAVLPLTCLALLLALRWAWRGAGKRHAAATTARAAAAPVGGVAGGADAATDDARRHATTLLLGAWLRSAAGSSPEDLLDAAKAGEPRPALDTELRDDAGMPLMAGRIADIDTAELEDAARPLVAAVIAQQGGQWQGMEPGQQVWRALAALQAPLASAVEAIQPWSERFAPPAAAPGTPAPRTPARLVHLLVALPEAWHAFERSVAQAWITQCVAEHSKEVAAASFRTEIVAASGPQLWLKADQLLQTLARESRDDLLLLAACHSDLSEAAVAALENARRLFTATANPKGVMPGEAAAALLLAQPGWPPAPHDDAPFAHLHRPAVLRRDKSIEAPGRVSSDLLQHGCAQAFTASQIDAAQVKALVCDADQHTARSTELFGATLALLPDLDPSEDMRVLGTVTGHTGAASTLAVIAAAAARAMSLEAPCAAVSLADPFFRLALIARPDAPATAAAAAAA